MSHQDGADSNTGSTSLERELARVVARLQGCWPQAGAGQAATIAAWVQEAAAGFAGAPIQTYVPILVERIVRRRIEALPAGGGRNPPHDRGPDRITPGR